MELRRLEYFVTLARERHFTRAAAYENVSQPNLSKQIQELERECGVPLIQRLGRQVHLTPAGEDLLRRAQAILAEVDQIRLMMLEYRGLTRGRLVVGAMSSPSAYLMPAVAARFMRAYPDVDLVIESAPSQVIYQGLQDNTFHIGLAYAPQESAFLDVTPLFEEELVLVVPRDHPLAGRESLPLAELANVPLALSKDMTCRKIVDQAFASMGIAPRRSLEVASLEGLKATIEQGLGVTLLPKMYLRSIQDTSKMACVRLVDPTPRETFALLTHRDRHQCAATRALIGAIHGEIDRLLAAPLAGFKETASPEGFRP